MSDTTPAKKTAAKKAAAAEPAKRRQRTPYERAYDDLQVEERRVISLTERRDRLKAELEPVEAELVEATERRDFLRMHPDLKKRPKTDAAPSTEGASS